ncbi:hypothetical protein [Spirillospora sp. NPDC048819]|uniref:hypothetical protein n=1 Tax=Spirillospora sp. NPDC048819 TaxID=3155268 RepID=UPI0033DC2DD6
MAILREGGWSRLPHWTNCAGWAGRCWRRSWTARPPDLAGVPGVTGVEPIDGGVRVSITGSPSPALSRLSACPLVRLRSHEPTLEEIFLSYYEAER